MTLEQHLRTPEISLSEYVRQSRIAIGARLAGKTAIYLDTKFWILLRDADIGIPMNQEDVDLLTLLRQRVSDGKLFCPIGETTFIELVKQADPRSRMATAKLIDELSLGIALIDAETRARTEIAYFVYSRGGNSELHPLEHLVWAQLSCVLGDTHPTDTPFEADTELALQKTFFDKMSKLSLCDIIRSLKGDEFPIASQFGTTAEKLNAGISMHANELRSFEQAYSAEIRGIIDLLGDTVIDVVNEIARKQGVTNFEISDNYSLAYRNQSKNLLAFALEKNRARDVLRTLHIWACLHASIRWNKGRKLKGNDLLDFDHAAAALAYCDAFCTERSLGTMIVAKHVSLDQLYGCRVITNVSDAINYVKGLP